MIFNGVEPEEFGINTNRWKNRYKLIAFKSLRTTKYAVEDMIEVMKHLPYSYLTIYGKGPCTKMYQKMAEDVDNVCVPGVELSREEMKEEYAKSGIYFTPTRHEAQGISAMEASSIGLPVVTTNNTAVPEYIKDKVNGFLINEKDGIGAYVASITYLQNNKRFFDKMSKNGVKEMKKYHVKKAIDKELKYLMKV
jgi:glycosyltransferase involved in cell wall biosynthesis